MLSITVGRVVTWSWTIYVDAALEGFPRHGSAETFGATKADVERNWQLWLDASGLVERDAAEDDPAAPGAPSL